LKTQKNARRNKKDYKAAKQFQIINSFVSVSAASRLFQERLDVNFYDAKLLIVFFLVILAWYCFLFFFKISSLIPFKAKATKQFQIIKSFVSVSAASRLFQESLGLNFYDAKLLIVFFLVILAWYCFFFFSKFLP
jgi:Fe2+ transport system protein B